MDYEYTDIQEGGRQYEIYDLSEYNIVKAEYVKSHIGTDNGNPYIEALPRPRDEEEINIAYTRPMTGYRWEEQKNLPDFDKLSSIANLRKIRYELPFHAALEQEFYMSLLISYRERRLKLTKGKNVKITRNDREVYVNGTLMGNNASAANAGITMLGYSGCGKSASLEILLSNYPQVIEHESHDMLRFTQIVYIVVVCPPNSNFSTLYSNIGREIDRALGNVEPFYESMVRKARTLGDKVSVVCRLIERFGIGAIILDEIQLLDFNGQKDSTFEGLLTIVNMTKVALVAVGTKDAYYKMFPNVRTSRRTGVLIEANLYCGDQRYFTAIVRNLSRYQWFDEYIKFTPDVIRALYDVTKGIIDQLIGVYMYMQIDYIRSDPENRPEVTAEYVHKIAKTYYPGMQELLYDMENPNIEEKRAEILRIAQQNVQNVLNNELMKKKTMELAALASSQLTADRIAIRDNAIANVKNTIRITGDVYNTSKIEKAIDHVMEIKSNAGLDECAIARKAYEWLKKNKSDKRYDKKKKKSVMDEEHIEIKRILMETADINI